MFEYIGNAGKSIKFEKLKNYFEVDNRSKGSKVRPLSLFFDFFDKLKLPVAVQEMQETSLVINIADMQEHNDPWYDIHFVALNLCGNYLFSIRDNSEVKSKIINPGDMFVFDQNYLHSVKNIKPSKPYATLVIHTLEPYDFKG